MAITDPLVLPNDVLLLPVAELPESVREKVDYKDGDFAITRPHVRTPSKIVDAQAAALLKEFQTAKTIVEAILDYSTSEKTDPHQALEQALPLLKNFIDSRLLVPPDSAEAAPILPTLSEGDSFDEFEIRSAVQILEDSELYQACHVNGKKTDVALKILRDTNRADLRASFDREAAVLKHLNGKINPRLIKAGVNEGRPFLAIEWFAGVPVPVLADELCQVAASATEPAETAEARDRLHALVISLLENYAYLHEQGIIHSDVHPNNLLVNDAGEIKILDFGLARFTDDQHPLSSAPRGGVGYYFEPECVQAVTSGRREPQSSVLGEQYAVAAVAYQLLTGATHINFSLRQEEMLRQILEAEPLPFSALGLAAAPEMERVLGKALSKDPQQRFASMREFTEAVRHAASCDRPQGTATSQDDQSTANTWVSKTPRGRPPELQESFIQKTLQRLQPAGKLFRSEIGEGRALPTGSANYGTAGIAYALLRLACNRDDPYLLSLADLWITKTLGYAANENAFYNNKLEITKDAVSGISMHHMAGGVHFVRASISRALADPVTHQRAIEAFIAASQGETENLDLTLGQSSVLNGCALLLEDSRDAQFLDLDPLIEFGDETMRSIWQKVDALGPVSESPELSYFGMAHGWAGVLYAALRWCEIKSEVADEDFFEMLPAGLEHRLNELAQCAVPSGRGLLWPWQNQCGGDVSSGNNGFVPGWCNGSAGHVFLWTLAHKLLGQESYLDLARKAAWGVWEQSCHFHNVCCGAAGCAYAFLNLYRHTGEKDWLARARQFGHRAVTTKEPPSENETDINSLYKGDIGLMLLLDDLANPVSARMPLFE